MGEETRIILINVKAVKRGRPAMVRQTVHVARMDLVGTTLFEENSSTGRCTVKV